MRLGHLWLGQVRLKRRRERESPAETGHNPSRGHCTERHSFFFLSDLESQPPCYLLVAPWSFHCLSLSLGLGGVGLSSRVPCPGQSPSHSIQQSSSIQLLTMDGSPLRPVRYLLHPLELGTPTWDRPGPPGLGERGGSTSLTKDVGVCVVATRNCRARSKRE